MLDIKYILEMNGIDKRFQGVHALKECSLNLKAGEVLALVGENGAGKSTMMRVLTGICSMDSGEIIYFGNHVSFKNPKEAQMAGISIVHQELNLMTHLTVAQNIFIGRENKGLITNDKIINRKTAELFKKLNINISPIEKVGNLSVGKQQMVEIAKAISYDSKIIVFDEPSSALTDTEIDDLFKIIGELKQNGVGIIYISHRMDEIKRITDRITVMRDGEYIATVKTADVTLDEVIKMMVGRTVFEPPKSHATVPKNAEIILKVEGLTSKDVQDISFTLRRGEILGFAGLMGAGRTEIARLLVGADPKIRGKIWLNGKEVNFKSPHDAVKAGICYLSEDRKRYGLALGMTVANNIVMPSLDKFLKYWVLDEKKISDVSLKYIDDINVKTPSEKQLVKNLSGGNQQKTIIAKWLLKNCDVMIFDEPTRGIDIGAKSEIYKLMTKLAQEGKSIILISSELPELLRMSDRIYIMCEGCNTGELPIEDADQNTIMKYATTRKGVTCNEK
ncbi:MAG TPA: sugar ABC transporter ATP-binding protein [Oscillospiraceae bacterium]|nr:sugar ABC transporter ATP-binding protein [Oscillospiraceae bacterium]HPF55824.1 sugar ABC transporter ATP-binding protein [Clostridiales bacterium]HPK35112.1 sugar ABC transporter ATP-binding protein [Oscillospiraceae bacterium]HPR75263.1 sugar ABC transporter ATP-binding protein [Oscillospiraceae bacterium]